MPLCTQQCLESHPFVMTPKRTYIPHTHAADPKPAVYAPASNYRTIPTPKAKTTVTLAAALWADPIQAPT